MHISLRSACGFVLAALLLSFGISARAQFNASLSGTVLDPTQAAIPGATVILTNNATQQAQTTTSGPAGTYHFNALGPGTYTLKATASGFQQNVLSNVAIAAETPRDINIVLQTGAESQTVTVNANTIPLLQTGDASIGTTIDGSEVRRLPIFGSDPYELLRTAPGISGNGARAGNGEAVFLPNGVGPGGSNSSIFQTENQPQILAAGQRVADNNYMIDGVSVNSLSHGGAAVVTPNEEAVSQMTVVSTSYDASLGRNTGAQIQVVTKSGTNQLHGSAFFLYDDPGLNHFNKYGGPANALPVRDQNAQRTWAASLGGPIVRDKLFFFLSYQGFKQKNPTYTNTFVETSQFRSALAAQRAGGISTAIVAANSAPRIAAVLAPPANACLGFRTFNVQTAHTDTSGQTYQAGDSEPACQVVSGGIDLGSLTPGGTSQLGSFPSTDAIATAPYYGASPFLLGGGFDGIPDAEYVQLFVPQQARGNQYNARIDYQVTPRDLLAGSVYFTKLSTLGSSGTAGSRPQADVPFKPLNSAATLIYIHTFSPTWLNELRGNVTRFADNQLTDAGNTVDFGLPYDNVQDYPFAEQFGVTQSTTTPAVFAENTYEVRDMATHTFGAHNLRMGFEARFEQDNDNLLGDERPVYAFDGLWAFSNDASVYESVTVDPSTGLPANTQRYYRTRDYAAFVQHDWKVTPNLTVNMGLRWEMFTPPYNKGSDVNLPTLGPSGSELAGMTLNLHHNFWPTQHNNWGPKVGFAWTPPALKNKVAVRGGYALAYNFIPASLYNTTMEDGPGVANFGLCCGNAGNSAGIVYAIGSSNSPASFPVNPNVAVGVKSNGFPNNGNAVEVYGVAPDFKYPSADLYSLGVQTDIGWHTTATIGYVGSSGRHFARLVDQNFLYNQANTPVYAAYFATSDSVMNYNALNVHIDHTLLNNIAFSADYTYGKSLDQVSNGDGADGLANQTNPANNASEYGPSDYDMRHHLVATWVYEVPKFHTGNALASALVNGFQVNGIYTFNTGLPWTPVVSTYTTVPIVNGAAVQNVVRPLAYYGGAGHSCSTSAFEGTTAGNFPNGGPAYFATTLPTGTMYTPGIGRNSFRSACYQDLDLTLAKDFGYDWGEHHTLLRLQANFYNVLNLNEAAPINADNVHNNVANAFFGLSPNGDTGRVIELQGRFEF